MTEFRQVQNKILGRQQNKCDLNIELRVGKCFLGKGENADYQHFLLFPRCFFKLYFSRSFKVGIVWLRINPSSNMNILEMSKLKAFSDVMKLTQIIPFPHNDTF